MQEELDADKHLDETIFSKFQTGELDLPSEQSEQAEEDSEAAEIDDLEEYYRELGIDPSEMQPLSEAKPKPEYVTREKKETAEQAKRRQRSELLDKMMATATQTPNYKILSRII